MAFFTATTMFRCLPRACPSLSIVVLSIFTLVCIANYLEVESYNVRMDQDVYAAHSLISHVIETHTVSSPLACNVKCYSNCFCVSFNFCGNDKKCELNSERKGDYADDYKENEKCTYYELSWPTESSENNKKVSTCGGCCLTSKPCLNGGECQAVDNVDGQRYQCVCRDGFKGKHCDIEPRSCADYAQSTDRSNGIHVIFTPQNTTLNVICHFRETSTMTLALSFSRANEPSLRNLPLTVDFPVSEELPNWSFYRLSLPHMQGLRDVSTHWAFTCAYNTRGFSTTDYALAKISETDITTYASDKCRLYEYFNIKNAFCKTCTIFTSGKGKQIYIKGSKLWDCDGLLVGTHKCSPLLEAKYFGLYNCYDTSFNCTQSSSSATQLWFIR